MIGRIIFAAAALTFSVGLVASPAMAAKKCGRLCTSAIKSAQAAQCTQTSKKEKRLCKRDVKKSILTACKAGPKPPTVDNCTPASPSGAFLD